MSDFFTGAVLLATLASGIRLATPYLLAGLGEAVGQRSGVLNLGVDGVMLLSAFFAYWTALRQENLWLAVLVGLTVGVVMGAIYAFITVKLKAEQGISGIGIFLFGLGFSDLMFQRQVGTPRPIVRGLPGSTFIQDWNGLTWIAFLLVPVIIFVLSKTTFGMNIRAVGENPEAADSLGVSVARTRVGAILIGNTMAGLAGTALVLQLKIFQPNLTQGLGFIAVALVYFGAWRPIGVMSGSLLYGVVAATILAWKVRGIIPQSASDIAAMAPAVLTVLALVLLARRVNPPAALTRPFARH